MGTTSMMMFWSVSYHLLRQDLDAIETLPEGQQPAALAALLDKQRAGEAKHGIEINDGSVGRLSAEPAAHTG